VDDGRPVGIVGFRRALDVPRRDWPATDVDEIMVDASEAAIAPDTPLSDALTRLTETDLRRLLVLREGALEGLLSMTDVSRVLELQSRIAAPAPESVLPTALDREHALSR
jgi:CBS domain-containing protein